MKMKLVNGYRKKELQNSTEQFQFEQKKHTGTYFNFINIFHYLEIVLLTCMDTINYNMTATCHAEQKLTKLRANYFFLSY